MIASALAVAAIALWTSLATLEAVARDGYGRVPSLAALYYPLP